MGKYESTNETKEATLINTIKEDCKEWERLTNYDNMFPKYLSLCECENSKESRMYRLLLNDQELWLGTLGEINAVVKSMVRVASIYAKEE